MPIQTPGQDSLKTSISAAFYKTVEESLAEITDEEIKKEAEEKAKAKIETLSLELAAAIDKHILDTIVIIKAGIPVSIKTNPTTGKGKTAPISTTSASSVVPVTVDLVNSTTGQGETTAVGTS